MVHMSSLMCTSFIYLFLDFFFYPANLFFFFPIVFLPFIWVKWLPEDYSKCFIRKNVITSWPFNKTAVSPRKNICSSAKRMSSSTYPKCEMQSALSIFLLNWSWLLWEIVKNWRFVPARSGSIKQWQCTFSIHVHRAALKRQFQNRPSPPLHPSTLYPLHRFLPVNLDPLLSWITLHTCVNKDPVSVCYMYRHVLCEEGTCLPLVSGS